MRGCRNTDLGSLDEAGEKASKVMKSSSGDGDVSGGCYLQLSSRRLEKPLVGFEKKRRKHPLKESKRQNRSLRVREMNDNLGILGLLRVKRRRRKKFMYRKIRRKLTTMAALKVKTCWNLMVQRGLMLCLLVSRNSNSHQKGESLRSHQEALCT
ncbi:hypothetical protein KY289_031565 [Solanum tuberosum]|nr:hypothetical protein KY289_031565 [Solanum tuberosum]